MSHDSENLAYKDEQLRTQARLKPRRVPEAEWSDHDREWMAKGTLHNRRASRRKLRDTRFTKHRGFGGHLKNSSKAPEFKIGTNHERHAERQRVRGGRS